MSTQITVQVQGAEPVVYAVASITAPAVVFDEFQVRSGDDVVTITGSPEWLPVGIDADITVCDAIAIASPCTISYHGYELQNCYITPRNSQLIFKHAIFRSAHAAG
jgi:hypothetical protein